MASTQQLVLLQGATAVINLTYAVQHKHSVPGSLIASGTSFLGLSLLGGAWREDVAVAIAWLLFFAALVLRGLPLLQSVSNLNGNKNKSAGKPFSGGGTF